MIDTVHQIIAYLRNQGQGRYHSPEEIDRAVNQSQRDLFNQEYAIFERTQKVSDMLRPFKKSANLTLVQGKSRLPADYAHATNHYITDSLGQQTEAKLSTDGDWAEIKTSRAFPPTEDFPYCHIYADVIEFLPDSLNQATLMYLRMPADALWAYTVAGDGRTLLYDSGNSIQLEWDDRALGAIIEKTAGYLGLSLRDADLTQWNLYKKQADTPVTDR